MEPFTEHVLNVLIAEENYRLIFLITHGPFPQSCYFCGKVVRGYTRPYNVGSAVIHHIDGDSTNHDPENLAATHRGCHFAHHNLEVVISPEARKRAGEKLRKIVTEKWEDPEFRAKLTGRKRSPESRENMRQAALTRKTNPMREPQAKSRSSVRMKRKWEDPAFREALIPIMEELAAANHVPVSCPVCGREIGNRGALGKHLKACRVSSGN